MCSVFRRRIASQMLTRLKPFLEGEEKLKFFDLLPLSVKLNQPKNSPPRFEILWKDIIKLNPELKDRVHIVSLMTYLRNQDFPTADGFDDISLESDKQEKIVFTPKQELFTSSVLLDICRRVETLPDKSTFFKTIPPENVIVEYSSPNIAKPFHYGHFRSTIMGNYIANLCQYVGHSVLRLNYVGDWGLQYGILAAGFNEFGCEEKLSSDALGHLFEVYRNSNAKNDDDPKFNETARNYFKKMEEGDTEALKLWRRLREISLQEMQKTYKRLNIKFDEIHGESMYNEKSKEVIDSLLQRGLAHCNEDGSVHVLVKNSEDKEDIVILRKNDGTSLYLSRDLAAALDRWKKYHFDSMYYVVDSAQSKHFKYLKSILKSMNISWESYIHHVPFGRILNFSTRKGNAVFLHDILNEAKERTLERMHQSPNTKVTGSWDEVADILGISALIINDFSCRRKKETDFSWDKVLSMNEDSGISLQYCHARLCRIASTHLVLLKLYKAAQKDLELLNISRFVHSLKSPGKGWPFSSIKEKCDYEVNSDCDLSRLTEPEAISLISHLARFDEVIYQSYISMEPHVLVHYLFNLRVELGRAIKNLPVLGSEPYTARARLLLFHSAQLIIKKSFQLLGIIPLSKM